jgi:peptidoglycan/LPS O-acetylase OafA/YrhL
VVPLTKKPALDGLRGVAILLVLAAHAGLQPRGGVLGVDLFFALSGFLITSLLLTEWHERRGEVSLRSFYRRRALRLLPALVAVLLAYLYYGLVTRSIGSPTHLLGAAAISAGYVANFFYTFDSGLVAHRLAHLWSLAAEEQFYVLWPPLLLVALRRRASPRMLVALLVIAALAVTVNAVVLEELGASYARVWYAPDTHSAAILLGCAGGIARVYGLARVPAWAAVLAVVAVVPPLLLYGYGPGWAAAAIPLFAVASVAVLLYVADQDNARLSVLLQARWLRATGKISYGIYLWHLPLMIFASPVIGAVLAFPVAAASYRWVEQPFLRRKKRVTAHAVASATPA